MRVKFLAQGINGGLWWGSNSRLAGIHQSYVRRASYCAKLLLFFKVCVYKVLIWDDMVNSFPDRRASDLHFLCLNLVKRCLWVVERVWFLWVLLYSVIHLSFYIQCIHRQTYSGCTCVFLYIIQMPAPPCFCTLSYPHLQPILDIQNCHSIY